MYLALSTLRSKEKIKFKRTILLFAFSFSFFSLMGLVLYFYPVHEEVHLEGEMINVKEIIPNTEDNGFYFLTVKTGRTENLLEHIIQQSMVWDTPVFYSTLNTDSQYMTLEEDRNVRESNLNEGIEKMQLAISRQLNHDTQFNKKLIINTIYSNEQFKGKSLLEIGDEIVSANGKSINDRDDLENIITAKNKGTISLKVIRHGKELDVEYPLTNRYWGLHSLGFWPQEQIQSDELDSYKIDKHIIQGGNSASLMMCLQLFYENSHAKPKNNIKISGTGGIEEDGTVTPIGGIYHKVLASKNNGAQIMFVPWGNYPGALGAKEDLGAKELEIIPVQNLSDAINYINEM